MDLKDESFPTHPPFQATLSTSRMPGWVPSIEPERGFDSPVCPNGAAPQAQRSAGIFSVSGRFGNPFTVHGAIKAPLRFFFPTAVPRIIGGGRSLPRRGVWSLYGVGVGGSSGSPPMPGNRSRNSSYTVSAPETLRRAAWRTVW